MSLAERYVPFLVADGSAGLGGTAAQHRGWLVGGKGSLTSLTTNNSRRLTTQAHTHSCHRHVELICPLEAVMS